MDFPLRPPVSWFSPPSDMPQDTHIQIMDNGRVFGYVTHWNRCLLDGSQECWSPTPSPSEYALAHCGDTVSDDGSIIKTANIGGGDGHAPGANGATSAARWYQDSSTQLARVRYGEDDNGIWFAGVLWPDVTEENIARLRASGLSGDWRWIGDEGHYDFIGACMVNIPGLPLYRAASAGEHPNIVGRSIDFTVSGSTSIPLLNDRARAWDSTAADKNIRKWASSDGSGNPDKMDWAKYRSVHFWYDPQKAEQFGGYKLLFADAPNGSPKVIWRAVAAVGAILVGSRGGVDIPESERSAVKARVASYYPKFAKLFKDKTIVAPWKQENSAGDCAECEDQQIVTAKTADAYFNTIELSDSIGTAFQAVLLVEGTPTSDGRLIEAGAATWRQPPLSMMLQTETQGGHDGAVIAGRIDRVWRADNKIMCSGVLDTGDAGIEAARLIKDGTLTGVSIDGAVSSSNDVSFDDATGILTIHKIEIMGATITPFPAAPDAKIKVASAGDEIMSILKDIQQKMHIMYSREEIADLEKSFNE